jgi:hypothetical protein
MGDVKPHISTEHFDRGFEQDDGNGAVNIVVAVEEDWFARGDGSFETLYGGSHAEHEKWLVQVGRLWIQESKSFGGGGDTARDKQLS